MRNENSKVKTRPHFFTRRHFNTNKKRKERVMKTARVFMIITFITCMTLIFSIFTAESSFAASAREIDVSVDVALERFYKQVEGAKEFTKAAKGMLIMPNVKKAGFFIGGQYGEGSLRIGGKTVAYYNLVAGSYGLTFGVQAMDIIIVFMTDVALKQFRNSEGWEVGIDGNVALIKVGAGERIDSTTVRDPIAGFVFDVKGLMVDVSLKGAKFTKVDKSN